MNDPLSFVVTQAAVVQLHARYTDAVWRKDLNAFADCFTLDAQWRIGGRVIVSRDAISTHMADIFGKFRRILLTMRNPYMTVTPEGAEARTYVTENNVFADGMPMTAIGTYFERIVKEDGTWRFSWRLFQTRYVGPADFSGIFFDDDNPDFGPVPQMPPLDAETIDFTGMHTGRDGK